MRWAERATEIGRSTAREALEVRAGPTLYQGTCSGVGRFLPNTSSAFPIPLGPRGAQNSPVCSIESVEKKSMKGGAASEGSIADGGFRIGRLRVSNWDAGGGDEKSERRTFIPTGHAVRHFCRALKHMWVSELSDEMEEGDEKELRVDHAPLLRNPGWAIPTITPSFFRLELRSLPTMLAAALDPWWPNMPSSLSVRSVIDPPSDVSRISLASLANDLPLDLE